MLQIIGWMGCLYLIVKALELFSTAKARAEDEQYDMMAMGGGALALVGAIVFVFLLNAQADAGSSPYGNALGSYSNGPSYGDTLDAEAEADALAAEADAMLDLED